MSLIHRNIVNLYISHKLDTWSRDVNADFPFGTCLFWAVKSVKNSDPGKRGYGGHGIGFGARLQFSLGDGSWGKNVVIFGADMNSSVHVDNKKRIS